MSSVSFYWQLVRLTSAGDCQIQALASVQNWVEHHYADVLTDDPLPHNQMQRQLVEVWRSPDSKAETADLARLSLRCYTSHYIQHTCHQLAQQFGAFHGFTALNLFPFVLDDRGQLRPIQPPFTLTILDRYDPEKSRLSAWTIRLTKNHDALNRYLFVVHGLYRVSDWAILNDTTVDQLQTILKDFHQCSGTELQEAQALLMNYHQVYRQARWQQRKQGKKTGRCLPPTPQQLEQIRPQSDPQEILDVLKDLARLLRIYRIEVRGGNPEVFRQRSLGLPEDVDMDAIADPQTVSEPTEADEFLQQYRQHLVQCLDEAIVTVIQARFSTLKSRSLPKAHAYLEGLRLCHGEGKRMGAIAPLLTEKFAPDVVLKSQVQVTRLLALSPLRKAVCNHMIWGLQQRVEGEAIAYVNVERLHQMADTLEGLLREAVEQVMSEAEAEAYRPTQGAGTSLFAHRMVYVLRQLNVDIYASS